MKTIYKYRVEVLNRPIIQMPRGAEILCVQKDEKIDEACIWAVVDLEEEPEYRFFEIVGTGHEIRELEKKKYIGTFQLSGGLFVGHLFESILD